MYDAQISRANPSCFLFLVDQSGSMASPWGGGSGRNKADELATILNRLLQNLVLRCAKEEGIRHYYDVGVIGYGERVGPALGGVLANQDLVAIDQLGESPIRVEERTKKVDDGVGGLLDQTVKLPIWVDPVSGNGTPMVAAIERAVTILQHWTEQHPDSFPPIVWNLTDGEPTDGDPSAVAERLKNLGTADGKVLLLNCHISSVSGTPIEFPASEGELPDEPAQLLFRMSSPLPAFISREAAKEGMPIHPESRGFVFQSDAVAVIRFLEIGTRPSNMADVPQME